MAKIEGFKIKNFGVLKEVTLGRLWNRQDAEPLTSMTAIKAAYPRARDTVLNDYQNDSICGTWERLADAVYNGGSAGLSKKGGQAVGAEKSRWAEKIAPHMNVDRNQSPSFIYFRQKLRELADPA